MQPLSGHHRTLGELEESLRSIGEIEATSTLAFPFSFGQFVWVLSGPFPGSWDSAPGVSQTESEVWANDLSSEDEKYGV